MQHGNFEAAAAAFRGVADAADAPTALRAQALVACGLMQENNRRYDEAREIYREVHDRFAGTEFARRAEDALQALEIGGAERGVEFRRRQDAAWDELFPAQAEAARGEWGTARPKLERAAARLEQILGDFRDHPKAKDIAIALGNTHMLLQSFVDAQNAYQQAIILAQEQSAVRGLGASGVDSIVLDAQERLAEAIRAWRRQWMTRSAWTLLIAIAGALLLLRPWRAVDATTLRLGASLGVATALLSVVAMGSSYYIRIYVDPHSPIEEGAAGLLVVLPGMTAVAVALGYVGALRGTLRWSNTPATGVAAALGALAALAVATCVINAYALFPILDSAL